MTGRQKLPVVPPPPRPRQNSSGLRPAFPDPEPGTPRENVRVVTYGEIAEVMDRAFGKRPVLPLLLLELVGVVVDLSPEDAELVLRVASRLRTEG